MQGQIICKIGNFQFCVFVQEKYELIADQEEVAKLFEEIDDTLDKLTLGQEI